MSSKSSVQSNRQLTRKGAVALCNKINNLILKGEDVRVLPCFGLFPEPCGGDESKKLCGVSFYGLGLAGFVQVTFSVSVNFDNPHAEFGVIPLENRVIFVRHRKTDYPIRYDIEIIRDPCNGMY
jgi:hypothetical protein